MTKILNRKTATELSIQKDIILAWVLKNVKNTTLNYRLEITDIKKKFVKDLKMDENAINTVTFGTVFSMVLEEQQIPYERGYNTQYYGICIEGIKGRVAIINTTSRFTGGKFDFDIINEKNLKTWLEKNVVILTKENTMSALNTFITTNDLFINFCYYFGLDL